MKDYLEYIGIIQGIGSPREIYMEIKEIYFKFLKESLLLNIGASAGLHVGLPHYNNSTFIELKVSLAYKII